MLGWWPNRCATNYATDNSQAVTLLARNDTRALDDLAGPVS